MKYLILFSLLFSFNTYAIDTDKSAHLATSYMLNTAFYGFYHKAFRMPRPEALIFSAFTTLAIGFTKEAMDAIERGDERFDGKDMFYNVLGTGLSVGTVLVFDF